MIISHFLFSVERFPSPGNLNELREFAYKKYPPGTFLDKTENVRIC